VILHPPIIALLLGSLLISFMLLHSSYYGIQILRRWDITSGSELQLLLERKTYLISTIVTYAFGFQLISLFLYVYTADDLCRLFVGAMCAAGTLFVNPYGYPTLLLKVANFIFAGTWLILNYTDNRAYDYPLIRRKYLLLLIVTPFILAETYLQARYFFELRPNIITSCCGSLFSTEATNIAFGLTSLPSIPAKAAFYAAVSLTTLSGLYFYYRQRGAYLFSLLSGITFVISVAALISFISLYFYELPTHHCPFCILQREYGYVGYPLYIALLGGAVTGLGVGILAPFRKVTSLSSQIPQIQRRLAVASVIFFAAYLMISLYPMLFSDFKLEGY
jgi:uncharacterized integral membrane protein